MVIEIERDANLTTSATRRLGCQTCIAIGRAWTGREVALRTQAMYLCFCGCREIDWADASSSAGYALLFRPVVVVEEQERTVDNCGCGWHSSSVASLVQVPRRQSPTVRSHTITAHVAVTAVARTG